MDKSTPLIEKMNRYGAHNYFPLPIVLERGQGAKVWDVDGREYLDFLSCYSALNFGHQHPRIVSTLKNQLEKICVCSRAFHSQELCLFSEELAKFCHQDMVLLMNSGAEAVETAIKAARKWGYEKKLVKSDKANIIVARNNFHGRTLTVISFSTEELYRKNFGPFTPGFKIVNFGDVHEIEKSIDENTVAILLEPIQAEAGILIPPTGYLKNVRELASKHNVLLMLDEIQTGLGRTGSNFCYEYENIIPDILILGKSLGGGIIPVSAVTGKRGVLEVYTPGTHGSTFGGSPLASAIGREAISILEEEKLSERAKRIGEIAMNELNKENLPLVKEIRGRGALIGIELEKESGGARSYCEKLSEIGVLCKETHDYVIRIAPPLVIEEEDLLNGVRKIIKVVKTK